MFHGPPNIWKFVRALGQEQILQHGELVQVQAVEYRENQNKVYESLNKRLVSLISKEQGSEIEPLMFLRNVSLNLELRQCVSFIVRCLMD